MVTMRTRTAESSPRIGYYWYTDGGTIYQKPYTGQFKDRCYDGYKKKRRKEYDLLLEVSDSEIQHDNRQPPVCTGQATFKLKDHCEYSKTQAKIVPSLYPLRGTPSRIADNNYLAYEILSKTNPFRAEFSVPLAIWELLDLSSLFRFAGATFAGFAAGSYLNYRFGWVQFVQDLKTLSGLVDVILHRVQEFESLGKHGGLRRHVRLYSKTVTEESDPVIHSSLGLYAKGHLTGIYKVRVSGFCRWRPTKDFRVQLTKADKLKLALGSVLDLKGELSPATFWNMIPFSWLVDYFYAIGDFLEASEGVGLIQPFDLSIGRVYRASEELVPTTTWPKGTITRGRFQTTIYARDVWVPPPVPPSKMQFLTATQLTTLSAIVLQFLSHVK